MRNFLVAMLVAGQAWAADWNWETASGITVTGDTIRCAAEYGWATTKETFPVTDGTTLELEARGPVKAQLEWFREDGAFLEATQLELPVKERKITELVPAGERPRRFRFKLWLEGKGAEVKLLKARVVSTPVWRKEGTKLVAVFDADSKRTPDAGLQLDGLTMKLTTEYSAFVFEDKVAYHPKATLLVDVAAIKDGAITVQALCWNEAGEFLKAVDLVRDMTGPGYTEVPVAMHKEEFPAGTAKLSFKVWLSGREATARLASLRYGIQP